MSRYGTDYNRRPSWNHDQAMNYDREFGDRGSWSSGGRDRERDWRSGSGHDHGRWSGERGMPGRDRNGWSRDDEAGRGGWFGMNHGWNGMDPGWNDSDRGRYGAERGRHQPNPGWRGESRHDRGWHDDRDLGDHLRSGWNRMRRGMRDMMGGGYDRGW